MSNTNETAAVVDSFFAHFSTGDIDAILGLFAESVDFYVNGAPNIPWSGTRTSREEMKEFFAIFGRELGAPQEFVITTKVVDADNAVVVGRNKFEVLATKKTFTNPFALHFTVREGRVTEPFPT